MNLKKIKEGYKNLKPEDHIRAKKNGHYWAVVGGLMATVVMTYRGIWFMLIFILALTWLQHVEYRKEKQSLSKLVDLRKKLEETK